MQPTDAAHGGPGWRERLAGSVMPSLSGAGCEWGTLRRVLVHRPGVELQEAVSNPEAVLWSWPPDTARLLDEFDHYVSVLKSNGVVVEELAPRQARPNHLFVRDLFVMTPMGAIISRMASAARAGEETDALRTLVDLNAPILGVITGSGVFEGPDLVFINPSLCLVATGVRTNFEGARQVRALLATVGIESILVQTTYGCGHLDGVLSILNAETAMVIPTRLSHVATDALKARGYHLLELTNAMEVANMAINMVPLGPNRLLMPSDCPCTAGNLRELGFEVIEMPVSAIRAGGGSLHCITGVIARDDL